MNTKYTEPTDAVQKVTVPSSIIYCIWKSRCGYGGSTATFEVRTSFVGEGASLEIVGKSEKGKKLDKITDTISRNRYIGKIQVPDDLDWNDQIYFQAKLSKQGLQMESNRIPVRPKIQVKGLAWDRKEAREGEIVKLTAEFRNQPDGMEAAVEILEFNRDGHHDKIACIPTTLKRGKIELLWEYQYHEDTHEIPTDEELKKYGRKYNPPEYFFTVVIEGAVVGTKQESGLLLFKDWIEVTLKDQCDVPIPDEDYVVHLPDGSTRQGKLDKNATAREKGIPPGPYTIEFPNL